MRSLASRQADRDPQCSGLSRLIFSLNQSGLFLKVFGHLSEHFGRSRTVTCFFRQNAAVGSDLAEIGSIVAHSLSTQALRTWLLRLFDELPPESLRIIPTLKPDDRCTRLRVEQDERTGMLT